MPKVISDAEMKLWLASEEGEHMDSVEKNVRRLSKIELVEKIQKVVIQLTKPALIDLYLHIEQMEIARQNDKKK